VTGLVTRKYKKPPPATGDGVNRRHGPKGGRDQVLRPREQFPYTLHGVMFDLGLLRVHGSRIQDHGSSEIEGEGHRSRSKSGR